MNRRSTVLGRVILLPCLLTSFYLAHATPPSTQPKAATWQQASPADQQAAESLFAEGSHLFKQWRFAEAEERYRAALTHWNHPLVYFYLSRTLEKQGDLVSAYEMLLEALSHEPVPLPATDLRLALALRDELESRLASLEVHCEQADTEVLLDGELWFRGPGQRQRMAHPGLHVLVARKVSFAPITRAVTLQPGMEARVELRLSLDEGNVARPRQPSPSEAASPSRISWTDTLRPVRPNGDKGSATADSQEPPRFVDLRALFVTSTSPADVNLPSFPTVAGAPAAGFQRSTTTESPIPMVPYGGNHGSEWTGPAVTMEQLWRFRSCSAPRAASGAGTQTTWFIRLQWQRIHDGFQRGLVACNAAGL